MIQRKQLSEIGETIKPHGINGEISATVDAGIELSALRCIIFDVDGIYVPFFIKTVRPRGASAVLLTIDGISNETEAAGLCGLTIFALTEDIPENENDSDEGFYVSDLVGFRLKDSNGTIIGTITGYDDSTANILLIIEDADGNSHFVPMADELVEDFDADAQIITLNLPKGLFDL